MKRFSCVLLALSFLGSQVYAEACTKEQARLSVERICQLVSANGGAALKEVENYRFCGDNYVWVQDSKGTMILHPLRPILNGLSAEELGQIDKNTQNIVEDVADVVLASGQGWVQYEFPKPGEEENSSKVSFVKSCPGALGWMAGAGVWVE